MNFINCLLNHIVVSSAVVVTSTVCHGLNGSTSCSISHWLRQWDGQISTPPQLRNRSTDFDEIRTLELPPEHHPQ